MVAFSAIFLLCSKREVEGNWRGKRGQRRRKRSTLRMGEMGKEERQTERNKEKEKKRDGQRVKGREKDTRPQKERGGQRQRERQRSQTRDKELCGGTFLSIPSSVAPAEQEEKREM